MWQFETTVREVVKLTPEIKSFRFDVGDHKKDVRYKPGQFFFVTIKVNGQEAVHHFTISNPPSELAEHGYVEFTKRITNSDYSRALDQMKPGDWAKLRGAQGDFTLPSGAKQLAFLSGGIGITPLRCMLRHMVDEGLEHDVVLIYGNNTWENIAFREELEGIAAKHKNLRMEYVLSGPDFPPDWQGKKGFVTGQLVMEVIPDFKERTYYLSGPERMVLALEEQLTGIKVPGRRVKRDYFPGYD